MSYCFLAFVPVLTVLSRNVVEHSRFFYILSLIFLDNIPKMNKVVVVVFCDCFVW